MPIYETALYHLAGNIAGAMLLAGVLLCLIAAIRAIRIRSASDD